jgi:citrate lyase subunit beta/citryl-CoA lyase/(S)-citramalyl-CoA lyase
MNWQNLLHVRRKIADIAAAHNIISIDTAYFDVHDQHGLFKECFRLKKIGFHAKAAIHISQIEPINKVFAPRPREIIQAQQIIKKYKETSGGAILLETSMIGPPFVILAQKILNRAKFRGLL